MQTKNYVLTQAQAQAVIKHIENRIEEYVKGLEMVETYFPENMGLKNRSIFDLRNYADVLKHYADAKSLVQLYTDFVKLVSNTTFDNKNLHFYGLMLKELVRGLTSLNETTELQMLFEALIIETDI